MFNISHCIVSYEPFQESPGPKDPLAAKLLASISGAHDVSDVNSVSWCPRPDHTDMFATAGDDGSVKVWRVVAS